MPYCDETQEGHSPVLNLQRIDLRALRAVVDTLECKDGLNHQDTKAPSNAGAIELLGPFSAVCVTACPIPSLPIRVHPRDLRALHWAVPEQSPVHG